MLLTTLVATLSPALAGSCDALVARIGSLDADAVATAYTALVKCDKKAAEANFDAHVKRATDSDALSALFLNAIDAEVWKPVWPALSKVTSYEARDQVALGVGEACAEHPKVVPFLQGAYFGQRDIEFQQWDDSFRACADPGLAAWVEQQVQAPPDRLFDEKFNTLLEIFVKARKVDSLPALAAGAVKAAAAGPFDPMIQKMGEAIAPDLGAQVTADDQRKLEEALVSVAKRVAPDKARKVADQLANAGADAAAAELLPTLFPDRVQGGGGFLYGAVAVEAGECGGKKTAYLHFASVTEPGKVWSVVPLIEGPLRATKAKAGKDCTNVGAPWPIITSPEPQKSASEIEKWVATIQAEWERKGYAVKTQKERGLAL